MKKLWTEKCFEPRIRIQNQLSVSPIGKLPSSAVLLRLFGASRRFGRDLTGGESAGRWNSHAADAGWGGAENISLKDSVRFAKVKIVFLKQICLVVKE